jgi:hypothetical protein
MKTIGLFLAFGFLFLASCDSHKNDKEKHQHEETTVKSADEHETVKLTLNGGQKWKLDVPTRENIGLVKQVFVQAATSGKPDYNILAADLETKTNKLVGECKMSGKDHDMLHVWLTDYLAALNELKSSDAALQETAFHKMESQLKSFDQYFE